MKKLLLILFALMFSLPCEASLSHNIHLTHTGLKPVPKSFQVAKSHFLPNYQTGGFSFDNSEDISVACPTSVFMYTKDNCAYPNIPQYSCGGRYRVCGCDRDFAYSAAQCEAMGKVGGDQSCTVRGGSDSGTVYYTTCKCPSSYTKLTKGQICDGGTECSYAGEKYCDSTSHIQCESNYKVCDQNKSGRSGSCTAGGVTKYIDCYCDENLYPQTNETCKADFGANAVVSGEICGNNERGKSCSCTPTCQGAYPDKVCGTLGGEESPDGDGCGGKCYKCNTCAPTCFDDSDCSIGSYGTKDNGCGSTCRLCETVFVSTEAELLAAIKEPLRKTIVITAGTTITTGKSVALLAGQNLVGARYYDSSAAYSKLVLNYDAGQQAAVRPQNKSMVSDLDIDFNIKSSAGDDTAAVVIENSGSAAEPVRLQNLKITVNGNSYNSWKVGVLAKNSHYTLNGIMDFDIKGSTENAGISNENSFGTITNGTTVNIYNSSTENGRGMFVSNNSEFNVADGATLNIRTSGINGNGIENNIGKLIIAGKVNILSTGQYGSGIVNNNWSTYGGSTVTIKGTGRVNIQTTAQNGEALNNPASNYNPGSGIVPNTMYLNAGCEISFKVGYSGSQGRWRMGNSHTIYNGDGGINSFVNGYNGISLISSIGNTVTVKLSR